MSVRIGDKFDGFQVISVATYSALEDYITLSKWFDESAKWKDETKVKAHQDAANELYQWFCHADNKGSLAFGYINKVSH